jgi:hypothetical protein
MDILNCVNCSLVYQYCFNNNEACNLLFMVVIFLLFYVDHTCCIRRNC